MSQSPRDRIAQRRQLQKQQSQIFLELLPVLDDLDRACNHWQQAQQRRDQPAGSTWWRRLFGWNTETTHDQPAELNTVIKSAYDGVSLIRQSLLDILERQAVTPIDTVGQPFDPRQMNAMGREVSPEITPNTVIKEVLKGYRWQDRVLREAQVIVAEAADRNSSSS